MAYCELCYRTAFNAGNTGTVWFKLWINVWYLDNSNKSYNRKSIIAAQITGTKVFTVDMPRSAKQIKFHPNMFASHKGQQSSLRLKRRIEQSVLLVFKGCTHVRRSIEIGLCLIPKRITSTRCMNRTSYIALYRIAMLSNDWSACDSWCWATLCVILSVSFEIKCDGSLFPFASANIQDPSSQPNIVNLDTTVTTCGLSITNQRR